MLLYMHIEILKDDIIFKGKADVLAMNHLLIECGSKIGIEETGMIKSRFKFC